MLQELLDTRVMVKNSMKLHNKLANQDPGKQAFIYLLKTISVYQKNPYTECPVD